HCRAGGGMADAPLHLEDELGVGAICSAYQPDSLDLLTRKRGEIARADEPYLPNATAVSEGQALALPVQLPSRLLVLHRAAIMLEAGIALLPRTLLAAVGIQALAGGPGASGGGLAGLGVELGGERVLVGQAGAEELEVIGADTASIHPHSQRFVADEL